MSIKLAIDCMGGDIGLGVTLPAAVNFLRQQADIHLILVGTESAITQGLAKFKLTDIEQDRMQIVHTSEVVEMDDTLEVALRRKKDSSMRVAINLVKEGRADAAISSGNTGALMAISRFVLKTLPGIERPAICSIMPNQNNGATYMLDLGANVDCEAQHLLQFALMASIFVTATEGTPTPSIGLLNVGSEDIKGSEMVKQAGELLRAAHQAGQINFYGNVEGNDIFAGTTEIVVCDGFVGNVTLKATEGIARMVRLILQTEFKSSLINKLGALIAIGALKNIRKRMNPSRYNGAPLLGLRGVVLKSHGGADVLGFENALARAAEAVRKQVLDKITRAVEQKTELTHHVETL